MNAAIATERLTKRYGGVIALDNVSLEIERGEMFGLIGHDGAGRARSIASSPLSSARIPAVPLCLVLTR